MDTPYKKTKTKISYIVVALKLIKCDVTLITQYFNKSYFTSFDQKNILNFVAKIDSLHTQGTYGIEIGFQSHSTMADQFYS